MKARNFLLVLILSLITLGSYSQQINTVQQIPFTSAKQKTVSVSAINNDWNVHLQNLENPFEGNKEYAGYLNKIKLESGLKYPKKNLSGQPYKTNSKISADTCIVLKGFEGNLFSNNLPNDNTMAISNQGMLISNINSTIYIFDTQNDTLLKAVSLQAFSDTLQLNSSQYDPKLLYDPSADRFVMAYLAGHKDTTSNIILAFSATNDPLGNWNLYYLPGNPLADTSWSDYPAIALTQDELFLTINLLKNTGEWQTAFKQSVIWQLDKNKGYVGEALCWVLIFIFYRPGILLYNAILFSCYISRINYLTLIQILLSHL
jgi:hypothetical protein